MERSSQGDHKSLYLDQKPTKTASEVSKGGQTKSSDSKNGRKSIEFITNEGAGVLAHMSATLDDNGRLEHPEAQLANQSSETDSACEADQNTKSTSRGTNQNAETVSTATTQSSTASQSDSIATSQSCDETVSSETNQVSESESQVESTDGTASTEQSKGFPLSPSACSLLYNKSILTLSFNFVADFGSS